MTNDKQEFKCKHCGNDKQDLLEIRETSTFWAIWCNVCSKASQVVKGLHE